MPSTSTQHEGPDAPPSLYALLSRDAHALAALRAVYSGSNDVLDAVWWREHPLADTPDGRPDPARVLDRLKARAFSRVGSAALVELTDPETGEVRQVPEAAAALVAAEARLQNEAAALDAALRDARPALDQAEAHIARTRAALHADGLPLAGAVADPAAAMAATDTAAAGPAAADRVAAHPASANADSAAAADAAAGDSARHPDPVVAAETWRRRSMLWMFTSIAAGLLLLAGVVLVVVQQVAPQATGQGVLDGAGSAADGTATPSPHSTDVINNDLPPGLTIFEDPGLAPRIPPQNIDPYYKPESLRLLGVADSDLTVYAVENRIDQPCLLAVYQDGSQSATCVTKEEFSSMGIELRITSLRVTRPGDPAPYRSIAQDVVFWNPDGSYGVSSSPTPVRPPG